VARRSSIGLATNPSRDGSWQTFDDPRHNPVSLTWVRWRLLAGNWARGYAALVRDASNTRRFGRLPGAALAGIERGEKAMVPAVGGRETDQKTPLRFILPDDSPEWIEGVAVVAGTRHLGSAREFLRFLAERGQADARPAGSSDPPELDGLVADLLGATLVDAQDELWAAWSSLERAGRPSRTEAWLTEAPPWPPASVEALQSHRETEPLMATLAAEVAPDPDVRAWLLQSWLRSPRPIDGDGLRELAGAINGRLAREPRFRAWLRAEWTAWARQRYRQVAERPAEAPT
jgi:hypothetical protein